MKTLTRNAYAKVNLALDVLRRREDGYHDVCMIMQNLSLYDTLTFTVEEADTLTITLACDKAFVPCDARNLIYKAIALMGETYHLTGHVHVELVKRIPVEAGMAGGNFLFLRQLCHIMIITFECCQLTDCLHLRNAQFFRYFFTFFSTCSEQHNNCKTKDYEFF